MLSPPGCIGHNFSDVGIPCEFGIEYNTEVLVIGDGCNGVCSLESLNGKLWLRDHSNLLLGHSIILFRVECALSRVSAIAMKAQSSTNPVESSVLPIAVSMRSAL